MAVYNKEESYFIPFEILKKQPDILTKINKFTYDIKKTWVALKWQGINIDNIVFDTMVAGYLLEYNIKDDIAYLANVLNYDIPFYETIYGKKGKEIKPDDEIIAKNAVLKAKFIYDTKQDLDSKIEKENLNKLFYDIEMPLTYTLSEMEYNGVYVDKKSF